MDNNQKIIDSFKAAKKPLRAGEVAEMSGIEKKEVEKLIKKLTVEGKLYSPVRCFYDIKK
ncbi:MAG: MarR family transcriptional regulator [Bacteroidetes bacterium]|nr:MarR family transcriptional regulator [Bacteroidota bacterium]